MRLFRQTTVRLKGSLRELHHPHCSLRVNHLNRLLRHIVMNLQGMTCMTMRRRKSVISRRKQRMILSSEHGESSCDDDGAVTKSSSESDEDDPNDHDYDPNEDAPATIEDLGYFAFVNFYDDDGIINLCEADEMQ